MKEYSNKTMRLIGKKLKSITQAKKMFKEGKPVVCFQEYTTILIRGQIPDHVDEFSDIANMQTGKRYRDLYVRSKPAWFVFDTKLDP